MAIVHTAMFEAMNSIEGQYAPYKFNVPASSGTSVEAAGVSATHTVLVKLFPDQNLPSTQLMRHLCPRSLTGAQRPRALRSAKRLLPRFSR